MFKRKIEYTPTDKEKQNNLTLRYSRDNDKIILEYSYWFTRVCDFPYSEFNWIEIKEHLLLIPKSDNLQDRHWAELGRLIEMFSQKWYFVIRNPIKNQSVPSIIHLHLLKL